MFDGGRHMNIKDTVKTYIKEEVYGADMPFEDNESLFELNILDSLKVIQLMTYIQSRFNLVIDPADMRIEDMETIESIAGFISRLQK